MDTYFSRPKKPSVVSHLSAKSQADWWTKTNVVKSITDSDGLKWKLAIKSNESVGAMPSQTVWKAHIRAYCIVKTQEFIETKVLDSEKDARLICLIGSQKVPLSMRPRVFQARSAEELGRRINLELVRLEKELKTKTLRNVKRTLIGRWIDKQQLFANTNSSHQKA